MAYCVNPYSERRADFNVSPTAKQPEAKLDQHWEFLPTFHGEPVPRKEPTVISRTIPVVLNSTDALSVVANEITFSLHMPHLGKLKPGTLLYVRAIECNQTEECDWAISGLSTWSFSLDSGSPTYALRARFTSSGSNVWSPGAGLNVPLCVSLKQPDTVFFGGRLVLTRIGATGSNLQNIANFYCRLHLLFKEP
jgi:hypothetical protein